MNLADSDVLVHPRLKTDPKTQGAAFARILSGTLVPSVHPLLRPNQSTQYDPACFQPGRICMQIWIHKSMNQQTEDNFGETLDDWKRQDFLSRMEISFQYEYILAHG